MPPLEVPPPTHTPQARPQPQPLPPLLNPTRSAVVERRTWTPELHESLPPTFQRSALQLMLCLHRLGGRTLPPLPSDAVAHILTLLAWPLTQWVSDAEGLCWLAMQQELRPCDVPRSGTQPAPPAAAGQQQQQLELLQQQHPHQQQQGQQGQHQAQQAQAQAHQQQQLHLQQQVQHHPAQQAVAGGGNGQPHLGIHIQAHVAAGQLGNVNAMLPGIMEAVVEHVNEQLGAGLPPGGFVLMGPQLVGAGEDDDGPAELAAPGAHLMALLGAGGGDLGEAQHNLFGPAAAMAAAGFDGMGGAMPFPGELEDDEEEEGEGGGMAAWGAMNDGGDGEMHMLQVGESPRGAACAHAGRETKQPHMAPSLASPPTHTCTRHEQVGALGMPCLQPPPALLATQAPLAPFPPALQFQFQLPFGDGAPMVAPGGVPGMAPAPFAAPAPNPGLPPFAALFGGGAPLEHLPQAPPAAAAAVAPPAHAGTNSGSGAAALASGTAAQHSLGGTPALDAGEEEDGEDPAHEAGGPSAQRWERRRPAARSSQGARRSRATSAAAGGAGGHAGESECGNESGDAGPSTRAHTKRQYGLRSSREDAAKKAKVD
jgi:hypothetical protein